MTSIGITGADEIEKVLEQLDGKDRRNTIRRAVRAGAKPFAVAMKREAAAKHLPKSFQKIPVKVSTHGSASGGISAYVRPKTPLFNVLEPGARAHQIAASNRFLSNQAGAGGRDAAFFAAGSVNHPGFPGRPIAPAAFAIAEKDAMKAFADVVLARGAALHGED